MHAILPLCLVTKLWREFEGNSHTMHSFDHSPWGADAITAGRFGLTWYEEAVNKGREIQAFPTDAFNIDHAEHAARKEKGTDDAIFRNSPSHIIRVGTILLCIQHYRQTSSR